MTAEKDGWHYRGKPEGGDCRKLVTLKQSGMVWVGIRAFDGTNQRWLNNGEPEVAEVLAWRDLLQPAAGYWDRGKLNISDGMR